MSDSRFMRRALELASRAEGSVSPRPPVGAVVASPGGEILGEGSTTPSPGPHAEVVALEAAGPTATGTTLYTTLEPCSHTSVTPPCTDTIVAAGVRRVVAGTIDPDPRVRGSGLRVLRDAGIEVRRGVLGARCRRLVEPFATWVETGRPLVTLKLAASLDGKVAAPDGTSRWISSEASRAEVHELRRRVDAVLVGAGTVEADDPALTARIDAEVTQPLRVVADSSGRTATSAQVFDGRSPLLMLAGEQTSPDRVQAWEDAGASVGRLPAADGGVDLVAALVRLGERGVCHVLCEGGPTLASSLVAAALVDRFVVYLAPKLVGGDAPGLLAGGVKTLTEAWHLEVRSVQRVGGDIRIEAERG